MEFEQMSGIEYLKCILCSRAYWAMWTKFHLRSLYDEGIERLGISFGEDVALSTQILVRSGKVVSINTPILDYYVYSSSVSHDLGERAYLDFNVYVRWFDDYIERNGLHEEFARELALFHIKNTQARLHWKKVKDVNKEMNRLMIGLGDYPEFWKLLSRREKKIVTTYRLSSLLGYWRLYYYNWKINYREMKIIERWKKSLYRKAVKHRLIAPQVIVLMDGGVCSQMHQYLLGRIFENGGHKVLYDLSFYEEWGTDMNYQFVRNFDLLKAFPYLKVKSASKLALSVYKKKYFNLGNNTYGRQDDFSFLQKKPPVYLGGYYHVPADIWLPVFRSLFRVMPEVLVAQNKLLYSEIDSRPCSVAVHVRRGDLKVEIPAYGKPASLEYFKSAVTYMQDRDMSSFFYFFSDEPDWVRDELIPQLYLTEGNCKIVDINGSDKGYMDLFLIARCKHQITSKGTLGKYGALLGDNSEKMVVLCNDEVEYPWKELLQNAIFL